MASHALTHETRRGQKDRHGVVRLGWAHFWLMASILGGLLGLIALAVLLSIAIGGPG